ncbi:MAG TPA: phage tail protein, partial [Xanthobacteraceae bacterium]|nr:phage tail protein [Xanthobacteraceae bacterium]
MSGVFGGGSSQTTTPDYTGLQIQTAVSTLPIPLIWGASRLAPNVVWYNNFQTQQGGGGKGAGGKGGLFGGGSGSATYTYSAAVIMALCEGPITGVNLIWKNQSIYSLAGLGLSLFTGRTPQSAWSYLGAAYPSQALAYQGTAYVCSSDYSLGDTATLDNHNFEVRGIFYGTGYGQLQYNSQDVTGNGAGYVFVDADPALIVADFLTNPQYGIGFSQASIDATTLFSAARGNDASFQTYCRAIGLALSPALTDQEQASSILGRWLLLTNTAAVWSGGVLKFIPYGDSSVIGNGITFAPDVTPIYNLDDDDFKLESNEDPLQVTRSDPYQAYNVWRLEIAERDNAYNLTSVESRDQNAIELYGMRIAPTVTAHEICDQNVALVAGQLMLQRAVYIRNTYKFRLSWEYCLLDPMDLVTVTDSLLGLSNAPVRITEIEEDENGFLQVTAEEFPLGAATATLYATQPVANNPIDRNIAADPVNPPIIFEPPSSLAGPTAQVWIAASGGA